jgi:hypothetical protein
MLSAAPSHLPHAPHLGDFLAEHPIATGTGAGTIPVVAYVVAGALAFALIGLLGELLKQNETESSDGSRRRRLEQLGIGVFAVSAFAGIARTFLVPAVSAATFSPQLDFVTLSWFAAAALGLALPMIVEITVGGVTLRLQQVSTSLLDETVELSRSWAAVVNEYVADIVSNVDDVPKRTEQFIRFRLREALEWLGTDGEIRRLAVWLYSAELGQLVFYLSNEISDQATMAATFRPDEGFLGACFSERMIRNEVDPSTLPMFKPIASGPQYRGLLCVPIDFGDTQVGVLTVDRRNATYFDPLAVKVMKQLTFAIGIAVGLPDALARRAL